MQTDYEDIINLPHHVSSDRPHMSDEGRAGQFAPFAALTGYDEEVKETARLTDEKLELDEYRAERINAALQVLIDNADERPAVTITFFTADEKKSGGVYGIAEGNFRRFDESDGTVVLTDRTKIPLADIYSFDGEILSLLEEQE